MARVFTAASSHKLEHGAGLVTAAPLSISIWGRPTSTAANLVAFALGHNSAGDNRFVLYYNALGTISFASVNAGAAGIAVSTTGYSANVWSHVAGVTSAANARAAYLNGSSKGTEATSVTPGAIDITDIGAQHAGSSTPTSFFDGDLAEAALWDAALDDAEVAALAKGMSPLLIRPQSLVGYWPVIGKYSPEIDVVNAKDMTVTSAVVSAHPSVFNPYNPPARWARKRRAFLRTKVMA